MDECDVGGVGVVVDDRGGAGVVADHSDLDALEPGVFALCVYCFGEPERQSASHIIFKPPKWAGQPTVNIQPLGKQAKGYQVREVLKLIEKSPRGRR